MSPKFFLIINNSTASTLVATSATRFVVVPHTPLLSPPQFRLERFKLHPEENWIE